MMPFSLIGPLDLALLMTRAQDHLVVVGDGKTYDHLLSLIREYRDELSWLVPFPGDWHLLKAMHPVIMKIYWDAGLKSMASAMGYRGDLLSVLEKASNFRKYHEFLLLAHEANWKNHTPAMWEPKGDTFSIAGICNING
eukprot:scpid69237/ scgid5182/ 